MGFIEEARDLASIAYESYLKNPHKKANYRYAIIDAIRRDSWGTRGGLQRNPLRLKMENSNLEEIPTNSSRNWNSFGGVLQDIERYLKDLKGDERAIFILRHYWGMTESEIGYCFGVSEARISQRHSAILQRIQKTLPEDTKKKSVSQIKRASEMEEMDREKTKRKSQISIYTTHAMETEESRQMEFNNEAGFDPWLT